MKYSSNELFNRKFEQQFEKDTDLKSIKPNHTFFPDIINDNIIHVSGCYFLESIYTGGYTAPEYKDKVGTEVLYNKILISDYIQTEDKDDIFVCAIGYANQLANKIKTLFSDNFKVVLGFDEDFYGVYFYKTRETESYLLEDLDEYKFDCILTIDTKK